MIDWHMTEGTIRNYKMFLNIYLDVLCQKMLQKIGIKNMSANYIIDLICADQSTH